MHIEIMDFKNKRVWFIGCAGVSMSALMEILRIGGAVVGGSDSTLGRGHVAGNITKALDLVVVNGAIGADNAELVRARELGIRVLGRDELLAIVESGYKHRIAVAGCHGKSTTVAMIGAILAAGGLNPTVHNGAHPNLVVGEGDIFVTEACEFKQSFLKLNPTVAVVTNVDFDHVDCYRDLTDVKRTFKKFEKKARKVIKHGRGDERVAREIRLGIYGEHNVDNAVLAFKVGRYFGVPKSVIKKALIEFRGISRRFEHIGVLENAAVISDYAHHPTEIAATIKTANGVFGEGKFLVVFQPHTFSRTRVLFNDFVRALGVAMPNVLIYKTFSAREKPIAGGCARDLASAIGAQYFDDGATLATHIKENVSNFSAVILMGAGDVNKILE